MYTAVEMSCAVPTIAYDVRLLAGVGKCPSNVHLGASAAHASRHAERGYRSLVVSTIYTVAKRAGVSTATVSRVLSQPEIVSPTTRHKVLQAVEDLGYTPNSAARNLRTLRTGKLLVTVPDISQPVLLADPPGHRRRRAARGLRGAARRHAARRDARRALRADAAAQGSRRPDLPRPPPAERGRGARPQRCAPRCAPVVNGCEFSPRLGVPSVHIDNAKAAAEAMDHLYRLGHRRIGIVTGPLVSPLSRDRLRGATARAKSARRRARPRSS